MHADVEGILLPREFVQIAQGVLGDEVCDVAGFKVERTVLDDVGLIVQAAAPADGVPVGESVLGMHAVPQVPLACQRTGIAPGCQKVGVSGEPLQILNGDIFAGKVGMSGVFAQSLFIQAAAADPVMHAVLRRNAPRQDGGAGRAAHR